METPDDILADLLRREPIFHRPEFPTRMSLYYFEIGATGQRYDRAFIMKHLVENPPVDATAANWQVTEPCLLPLSPDTFLLTYRLNQQPRIMRRATIWQRTVESWEIHYHQGTIVS